MGPRTVGGGGRRGLVVGLALSSPGGPTEFFTPWKTKLGHLPLECSEEAQKAGVASMYQALSVAFLPWLPSPHSGLYNCWFSSQNFPEVSSQPPASPFLGFLCRETFPPPQAPQPLPPLFSTVHFTLPHYSVTK